jgi:hypothetical protein
MFSFLLPAAVGIVDFLAQFTAVLFRKDCFDTGNQGIQQGKI